MWCFDEAPASGMWCVTGGFRSVRGLWVGGGRRGGGYMLEVVAELPDGPVEKNTTRKKCQH